jgi:hypothetical protein
MKENEEKNSNFNQNISQKIKEDKDLHYKKIKIKSVKNDDTDPNYIPKSNFDNLNKINFPENNENEEDIHDKEEEVTDEKNNFMFEDINNQLDEILENIENDGIEEINKKIKLLNEDKNMFNTISYSESQKEKDINFKKIDNKNKFNHKRNKMPSDKNNNNHINNYKHFNQNNKHNLFENRNISNNNNNRYLFSSLYNTHRNWKEEDNCNNEDNDNYMNKTNISLFYKYNKYNFKKGDEE